MRAYPCLICESDICDTVYSLRRDPYLERLGLDNIQVSKVMCRDCGLVYSRPRFDEAELKHLYETFRNTELPSDDHLWWKEQQAQKDFEWVQPYLPPCGSVLEIGCSEGSLLRQFQRRGWDTCGIEPSSFAGFGRTRFGLDIRQAIFEEANLPDRSFDLVAALRVLEHLANPRAFLSRVDILLKAEGLLYLEVPNVWRPRNHLSEFVGAQHLWLFSRETLILFLEQTGFESVALADYTSGLRALLKRKERGVPISKRLPLSRARLEARKLHLTWQGYRFKYFWTCTMRTVLRCWMDTVLGPTIARRFILSVRRFLRIARS